MKHDDYPKQPVELGHHQNIRKKLLGGGSACRPAEWRDGRLARDMRAAADPSLPI